MLDLCHGCQLTGNPLRELLRVSHHANRNEVEKCLIKVNEPDPNESYHEVWLVKKTTEVGASELIDEQGTLYETTFIFCCDDYDDAKEWYDNPSTSDVDTDSESENENDEPQIT